MLYQKSSFFGTRWYYMSFQN